MSQQGSNLTSHRGGLGTVLSDSCDPMDNSPPGSSVHGILQARTLEWVSISSPGDLLHPGIEPRSSVLQADSFPAELQGSPKFNIHKMKIMASTPITLWQIDGETVTDFILGRGGYKITADGDCSHEIKRCLFLGRKVMTNLDSILKSRDITLPTKVHLVKAMVSPVVMYGCGSWTMKKAEHRRIDAFELWYWRRLLRVPWATRKSNQSILKEISPG